MVDGVRNGFGAPGRRGRPRSWVYTAGTVARIDLRLPHHPRSGSPLLRCVRYNRSQARAHPASAAARQLPSITRITRPIHTTPPHPLLSAVFAQAANSARRERTRALQWAACLGTRAAQRRGASVTTWCPARVRADGPRNTRPSLPCPFLTFAAASSRNVVPMQVLTRTNVINEGLPKGGHSGKFWEERRVYLARVSTAPREPHTAPRPSRGNVVHSPHHRARTARGSDSVFIPPRIAPRVVCAEARTRTQPLCAWCRRGVINTPNPKANKATRTLLTAFMISAYRRTR